MSYSELHLKSQLRIHSHLTPLRGRARAVRGLSEEAVFDREKIIPDMSLSLREGAILPLGKYHNNMLFAILESMGHRYGYTLDDPIDQIGEESLNAILNGIPNR